MYPQLTASLEDYLEAIAGLTATEGHAHAKEIAGKLNVKMPSVTGALRQLEKMGYIVYNAHYPVELTPAGKKVAEDVVLRHGVLKKFFGDILGLSPEKASQAACHLEHVVDSDTIERFVLFSRAIEFRSDAKQLQNFLSEAIFLLTDGDSAEARVLSEVEPGKQVSVFKIGRNIQDTALLPVSAGDKLKVAGLTPDKGSISVEKDGAAINIPLAVAENLWVLAE